MRRGRVTRWYLLVALGVGLHGVALGDTPPGAWESAKDATARERFVVHSKATRLVFSAMNRSEGAPKALSDLMLERARVFLEEHGAAESPDVRLRFDLGEVYQNLHNSPAAVKVLVPALAEAPDHPGAERAWLMLAYAYAYSGESVLERGAWEQYLKRTTREGGRATALLNLAEADMRVGDLRAAIDGYRDAEQFAYQSPAGQQHDGVLAVWGLAVALDRVRDERGAVVAAKRAIGMDAQGDQILDKTDVFFVPEYERRWYVGLGTMAAARDCPDATRAAWMWGRAERVWAKYIEEAEAALKPERWLPLARSHLQRCAAERATAEKKVQGPPFEPNEDEKRFFVCDVPRRKRS